MTSESRQQAVGAIEATAPAYDAGSAGASEQAPPAPQAGPTSTIEDELSRARDATVARSHFIGVFQIGDSTPVSGQYPDGEVEPMTNVVVSTSAAPLKAAVEVGGAAPAAALLNDTRKPLDAGSFALLFLRRTPDGRWFILDAIPLGSAALPDHVRASVEARL